MAEEWDWPPPRRPRAEPPIIEAYVVRARAARVKPERVVLASPRAGGWQDPRITKAINLYGAAMWQIAKAVMAVCAGGLLVGAAWLAASILRA